MNIGKINSVNNFPVNAFPCRTKKPYCAEISFKKIPNDTSGKVLQYEEYLKAKTGKNSVYIPALAVKSIDETTGEISPVAKKFIDYVFMQNNPVRHQIYNAASLFFYNSNKNLEKIRRRADIQTIIALLCSLKNKKGGFEEKNLFYFRKLINTPTKIDYVTDIPKLMEEIKDEKGVADSEKFKFTAKVLEETNSYSDTLSIIRSLNRFPKEKWEDTYNNILSLRNPKVKKDDFYTNFPVISEYCFEPDGTVIDENYNFIKVLSENTGYYGNIRPLVDVSADSEDNRSFILEILSKMRYKSDVYSLSPIYQALKKENNTFPDIVKENLLLFAKKGIDISKFETLYYSCLEIDEKTGEEKLNKELFEKTANLMEMADSKANPDIILPAKFFFLMTANKLDISTLEFRDKINMISLLEDVNTYIKKNNIEGYEHFDKMITSLKQSINSEKKIIPVKEEDKQLFLRNVLIQPAENNKLTEFEKVVTDSIPQLEKMYDGLTLTYSRAKFLNKLTNICNQNPEAINILKQKTGIEPKTEKLKDGINITGYDGIMYLDCLDVQDKTEKQIYDCMYDFMYNNRIETGNEKLDEQLNYIIKAFPEFINTIGKKQHSIHKYTLDIHQLLVLAYSMNNPKYKELTPVDKIMLKMTAIFHDLMKQERMLDENHPHSSAIYVKSIAKKIIKNPEQSDRLYELINNHHWLKEWGTAVNRANKAEELAVKFRRPGDFEIAQILADADLKAISPKFYEDHVDTLKANGINTIKEHIDYLYSTGNAIFSDSFVSQKALADKKETYNGKEYTVINFHNIKSDEDMGKYGFEAGKTKKEIQMLVHMLNGSELYNNLNVVKMLSSAENGGVLSETLITPVYKNTFGDRLYGLMLSQINTNVISTSSNNQGSGYQKDISNVMSLIFRHTNIRTKFKKGLLANLGISPESISDKEFEDFYKKEIALKNSFNQYSPSKEIRIGNNTITGKQLVTAMKEYQDSLISKTREGVNEVVGYMPKIQGVIAKAYSLSELPEELLQFAYENNYPVMLI